jgi:hypothetical protein
MHPKDENGSIIPNEGNKKKKRFLFVYAWVYLEK